MHTRARRQPHHLYRSVLARFGPRLLVTSLAWMAGNFAFYGDKLFQSEFIHALYPEVCRKCLGVCVLVCVYLCVCVCVCVCLCARVRARMRTCAYVNMYVCGSECVLLAHHAGCPDVTSPQIQSP